MFVRKLGILIILMLSVAVSFGQYSQNVDTLFVKGGIKMDTNRIQQLDTATDSHDAVPLFQIMDSIQGSIADSSYWVKLGNYLYPEAYASDSVGIGTNSPTTNLDVVGNIKVTGSSGDNSFYSNNTTLNAVNSLVIGDTEDEVTATKITMDISTGGIALAATLTTVGGNAYFTDSVGINNSSPTQELDVDGNMRLTGGLYDGNNEVGTSGQILSTTGTATDWINAVDTARIYDSLAVHLDTLQALRSDLNGLDLAVDATNISQVGFTFNGTTIKESFDHMHLEYALQSEVDSIVAGSSKWIVDDSTYLTSATDIGVQGQDITGVAAVQFSPQTAPTHSEGLFYYDSDWEAFTAYNAEADISLQVGQENWKKVKNETGATIYNGQPVYVNGSTGVNSEVGLAVNSTRESSIVLGIATHDIENNSLGYVTTQGEVRGIDTDGSSNFATGETWADGDELFLSDVAGDLTNARPTSGYCVHIGHVDYANSTNGIVFVNINIDGNLDTLMITDVSGEDSVLVYDNGTKAVIETDNYLELASDSVTLSNEVGVQDGSNALVTSNEVYDYFSTNTIRAYKAEVRVGTGDVATLGTSPYTIISAPGSGKSITIIAATMKITPSTQLDVGTQILVLGYDGTPVSWVMKINNTGIEYPSTGKFYFEQDDTFQTAYAYPIYDNADVILGLSTNTNPTSGSAVLDITVYYTIDDY